MEETTRSAKPAAKRAGMIVKSKKKRAIARAVIYKGTGQIKVNSMNLNSYAHGYIADLLAEPVRLAGDTVKEYDIDINVHGSGQMSQTIAIRSCIAKAFVRAKGKKLRETYMAFDRALLVDDVRRVEKKKPLGRKGRKRRQHSKR